MKTKNKHRGWQRVLLLIVPYIFIVGTITFIGSKILGIDLNEMENLKDSGEQLGLKFFDLLGTLLVLWLFMSKVDKEKFVQLGFQTKNRAKDLYIGIAIGAITMVIGYILLQLLGEISFEKLIFDPKEIVISILLFIIVAIVEEVLLRGYILRNLMISFNKYIALIVSSILFSLMHGFNPNIDLFALSNLFLAGIVLGLSYIHTKNLWFPIAQHFSWNFFQSLLGFNVSGQDTYSLIEYNTTNNNLLNGGAFGFEGSILSVIAMIITIVLIEVYYRKKQGLEKELEQL